MNDEDFGFIARLLCRQNGIESEALGNILWELWDAFGDDDKGEWKK